MCPLLLPSCVVGSTNEDVTQSPEISRVSDLEKLTSIAVLMSLQKRLLVQDGVGLLWQFEGNF